ncbi:MAG: radical SAM protein [Desulfuromonadales bacterium C00003093]|nr:MAG: radical SAM protein [Desulfuromonadales bacterium C00003093]
MSDILLIQPPVVKATEPPLSLAVLTAALQKQGHPVTVVDANLDAFLYLLSAEQLTALSGPNPTTSIHRALRHRQASLDLLRSPAAGTSFARYSTAVRHLNRLLTLWCRDDKAERLTLGNYRNQQYSVFAPDDLQKFVNGTARTLFRRYFQEQLLPQFAQSPAKLIALSINYLHQALPAFELAGLLRRQFPAATLVAGGGLITSWQRPLRQLNLRLPPFDHLVFGPGEAPLVSLATEQAGGEYFLADAGNIGFCPDFDFARLGEYFSPEPVLPVSSSRGCYWQNCLFCPEAVAPVHPYRAFAPEDFPLLLSALSKQHKVRNFHLTDNAIPVNILRGLAARRDDLQGLRWFGFVRFEPILENGDFVQQLSQAGCRMLQLGLESGSQQVLDRLGKGITVASAKKILGNLHEAGIAAYVYIMLGTPGETEADAEMTLAFLEAEAEKIAFLNISIMNLPRSSGMLDDPAQYGMTEAQLQDDRSELGLYQRYQVSGDWDRSAARRFLHKRLLGSAVIRERVNRKPPMFTSNHSLFFLNGLK